MASTDIKGIELPTLQFIITTAGNEHVLPNAPSGWEKILVTQARDTTYYAVKRTYSVPMDFVLDGAFYLREQFYLYGIQAAARLTINQLDPATQTHKLITSGDIDFSQFSDTDNIVTVNLMDSGIESKIKAYGDVVYELDLTDGLDIELTPLVLEEQADFIIIQPPQNDELVFYWPQLNIVNNQQVATLPSVRNVAYAQEDSPDWTLSPRPWFLQPKLDTTLRIKGYADGITSVKTGTYQIQLRDNTGAVNAVLFSYLQTDNDEHAFHAEFDVTINAVKDALYYIWVNYGNDGSGFQPVMILTGGQISATYNTISPATNIKALRPMDVFTQLITKMNTVPYPTQSFLLSQTWMQLCITSGDAIRGLTGAKLRTSWNDFWQSINAECNAEFGNINGVATIEAKNVAFKRTLQIVDVGLVKDFKLSPYTEIMASNITVGYDDQTYDQTGGRTEFNSTQYYTTPITRVQKELNLVSKYRADSLGIEITRINLDGKESTDSDSDNSVWFIYVKDTPEDSGAYQPEGIEGYMSVTGVGQGVYNLKLSPKQMLYRWGNYLSGMLDKLSGGRIMFASATKDVSMVTVSLSGTRIAENENVNISVLGQPLFLPYTVTFKCKLPPNTIAAMQSAPNGYVAFTYDDMPFRGFVLSEGIDPAHNSEQELTVLLTPDNNLGGLIK